MNSTQATDYQVLCTLSIFHEYVNDILQSDEMALQLSPAMQKLCRNEGLIVKQTSQGISILCSLSDDELPEQDVCLQLGVRFIEPTFFNLSSEGLNAYGSVICCSNEYANIVGEFEYLHAGNVVDAGCVESLSEQPQELLVDGISMVVKLNLTSLIKQVRQNDKSYAVKAYAIHFAARSLRWVYWLWFKQGKLKNLIEKEELSRLCLSAESSINDEHEVEFNRFEGTKEVKQQKAVGFISSLPLKLGVASSFNLSVFYQDEMGDKLLLENLPHPVQDCLEHLIVDEQKITVAASHISL